MITSSITDKLNKYSSILRILGLLLVIVSFVIFIYNSKEQEIKIQESNLIIAQIEDKKSRKDTLAAIVKTFLSYRESHSVDKIDELYADTVLAYFKNLKNFSIEDIKREDKKFWTNFKNDSFHLKSEPDFIITGDSAKAMVKGFQCKTEKDSVDQIVEIKFNTNNKINSVRAYYAK